jgi:phage shock protein PspC (stress-responsive transcriptional regulator)
MKKTITINLGGSIFSIDEDAYDLLRNYLNRIESHFSDGGERADIMADIEGRIAELFSLSDNQNVRAITIYDVEKVIEIMGQPEDIADSAEVTEEPYSRTKSGKRIYRDVDRRILGGVCSGMAAYLAINVIWVRILFVILGLAFFSGILIYILLWIVIPPARTIAQKLEMKGEPVNISNIGKAVKDEFDNVRKNLKI